ncbi:MAG: MFS transporter [Clostridia bacterium]|nr:MFS transporter [Clostridia bacterium]
MGSLLIAVIYLIFVSLGLPDSLLGAGWPTMQISFGVPSYYAGFVSMTICFMTIVSALLSPRLIRKVPTIWIVIGSTALTVLGLIGFSFSNRFPLLFLFAVPYGLGAGAIDASVNHYVASRYSSSVMNFLHCFWGIGASISPNLMALAIRYAHWNEGYRWTACLQLGILLLCFLSIPLWKRKEEGVKDLSEENRSIREAIRTPGVLLTLISFFAYCSGEATCFLWTSSYFAAIRTGVTDEMAASFGSLVFAGLMFGRFLSGLFSNRIGDRLLIRIGIAVELAGILLVMLPFSHYAPAAAGFFIIGTGMGPVYPSIQHLAPSHFGERLAAPVIGLQMASAYVGSTFIPMIFGSIQYSVGIGVMPFFLLVFALLNLTLLEGSFRRTEQSRRSVP